MTRARSPTTGTRSPAGSRRPATSGSRTSAPTAASPSASSTRASGSTTTTTRRSSSAPTGASRSSSARTRGACCRRRACARAGCAIGSPRSRSRSTASIACGWSPRTSPAGSASPTPTRSSSAGSCGCSGAAAAGTRRSRTPATARTGCPPASCSAPAPRSGPTRSTAATARRNIHGVFTEGHANHFDNSLYYLRLREQGLLRRQRAAGSGSLRNVPLPISKLERIYSFTKAKGSAWPHDIAADLARAAADGLTPAASATATRSSTRYHNGERWISRQIVEAGPGFPSFTSGGATLDHEDPRIVYLSRRTGDFHQVEAWFTPDDGRTWRIAPASRTSRATTASGP